ncbi:protein LATERAL BRANCHING OXIDOREDUCTASE 1-like [Coffea arabica]|uniref:Protein LATERAL BRANCHING OXIDOREDUCTASE 1-like n=1 Tax=Coffea arabica TaxID=13443 RepID=A0A6P6UI96_COFAR|nr:protein DMR6-LIKE OXYGENASE 2-like [Coffea arabica]
MGKDCNSRIAVVDHRSATVVASCGEMPFVSFRYFSTLLDFCHPTTILAQLFAILARKFVKSPHFNDVVLLIPPPAPPFHAGKSPLPIIRVNHYPPCPSPDLALAVGRHNDGVALTILAQDDVGGLEVKRKNDGEWILVKPIPNAYIINIGDIIQVWSNDKYESVEHRAILNSETERFSIPFFFNPAHYTWVEPLEELINEQNPRKYKAYNCGKYFATRKRGNLKELYAENVQICHFKIDN